jgi:hypothetical protein
MNSGFKQQQQKRIFKIQINKKFQLETIIAKFINLEIGFHIVLLVFSIGSLYTGYNLF